MKRNVLRKGSYLLVAALLLGACSEEDVNKADEREIVAVDTAKDDTEAKAKAEAEAKAKAEAEAKAKAEAKAEEEAKAKAEEEAKVAAQMLLAKQLVLEQEVLALYQKNLDMVSVTYNEAEKSFNMIPTEAAFIAEIYATFSGGLDISHWNKLVDGFISMSVTQEETLGSGYRIALFNPANTDNVILTVLDGEVTYDAFNE